MKDVERRMNILEQNAKSTIQNLKKIIRDEEDRLYGDVVSYLRSRTFTETVFAIEESESAIQTKDWKKVVQDANVIIGYRITEEINKWEKADRRTHGIKTLIMDKLEKDCLVCEKQLKEIESKKKIFISFIFLAKKKKKVTCNRKSKSQYFETDYKYIEVCYRINELFSLTISINQLTMVLNII